MYYAERTSLYEEHQFYTALRERIERLVRRYCRANDDDVEDLTQECLLRVYNNLDSLRDLDKMEPWLRTVVRNAVFSWYRERKREQEVYSLGLETEHEAAPYSIPKMTCCCILCCRKRCRRCRRATARCSSCVMATA
jgi:DNA-directed RNA polymerase specialized sigma24 family protein